MVARQGLISLTTTRIDVRPTTMRVHSSARECPGLRTILRRVALSLLVACAIPAALFYTLVVSVNVWAAIVAALAWSYGAIAWRAATGRRTSGLLILTATVMTARTALALLTHSTFLYFLQPIITDVLVATTLLLSLATARPVVARLAGDFYPMDDELAVRPRVKRLFWHLTLLWALLSLGKGCTTLYLLHSESLETFVLVKGLAILALNASAIAATIGAAALVARKEGLLPAPRAVPVPA
jgi:hypothetical protein